jgi:hypothetical protein
MAIYKKWTKYCSIIKIMLFWNVTLCSLVDRYHHLEKPASSVFRVEVSVMKNDLTYVSYYTVIILVGN